MRCEIVSSGCHLFIGSLTDRGYGVVTRKGKRWRAHRLAWTEANGPIPEGMDVLHSCDVRNCINVAHLFLGDSVVNNADRHAKGRSRGARRTAHGSAKLAEKHVALVKASTLSAPKLAAKLGVSATAIRKIRQGRTWRD